MAGRFVGGRKFGRVARRGFFTSSNSPSESSDSSESKSQSDSYCESESKTITFLVFECAFVVLLFPRVNTLGSPTCVPFSRERNPTRLRFLSESFFFSDSLFFGRESNATPIARSHRRRFPFPERRLKRFTGGSSRACVFRILRLLFVPWRLRSGFDEPKVDGRRLFLCLQTRKAQNRRRRVGFRAEPLRRRRAGWGRRVRVHRRRACSSPAWTCVDLHSTATTRRCCAPFAPGSSQSFARRPRERGQHSRQRKQHCHDFPGTL